MAKVVMKSTADARDPDKAVLQPPVLIPLEDIVPDPNNVRSDFRPVDGIVASAVSAALGRFADEIAHNKLLHPITVIELSVGKYQIVVGERRWRAFRLNRQRGYAHYDSIPAYIRRDLKGADAPLLQISENLQREDVSDLDVARALKKTLDDFPALQKQKLAKTLKKPPSYISRLLGLIDPRYAQVVDAGIITYAAILEQFKALPEDKQQVLVQTATEQKRSITSGDVAKARKQRVPEDVRSDVASVLQQLAPQHERYERSHAAASRKRADANQIVDHGGDPVFARDEAAQFGGAPLGHFDVRLSLAQIALLSKMEAFAGGSEALSQTLTVRLTPEALRDAIIAIGGEMPKQDGHLPMALITRVNSFF